MVVGVALDVVDSPARRREEEEEEEYGEETTTTNRKRRDKKLALTIILTISDTVNDYNFLFKSTSLIVIPTYILILMIN